MQVAPCLHTMRSPRVGNLAKNTAGSGGVGVRSAGGRMRKHSTAASTVAGPSKNISAATTERATSTRKVAVGSCQDRSACGALGGGATREGCENESVDCDAPP